MQSLRDDADGKQLRGTPVSWIESSLRETQEWLEKGAPPEEPSKGFARLRVPNLRDLWRGRPAELARRPWLPWAQALDTFLEVRDRFWVRFVPLASFARDVRGRVEAELTRRRALTYDQMLSRLAGRVTTGGGPDSPIAVRIRERFDAALVDEFQDTDEAQWRVIEAAFRGRRRLFLIGDPKQAIYSFRGADVHVYLQAAQAVDPGMRQTMGENWRSDPPAVDAMNTLFRPGSNAFDQPDIDYVHVEPRMPERLTPTLTGLQVRWVDGRLTGGEAGAPISKKATTLAAKLVAREALAWLEGHRARILDGERPRHTRPRDLAVLVNTNDEAQTVHQALGEAGIPSVSPSKESVFQTPVARWLGAWLDAVAGAGRDREARVAAVTPLFGWTADELAWALAMAGGAEEVAARAREAGMTERDWNLWTDRLRVAAERWQRQGFARVFDREATDYRILPRVLAMTDGERHATDLRHLFELLHVEERTRRLGPRALAQWLRGQGAFFVEAHLQRLESDALSVRIETVHVSKGLQYPVVLAPYGWSARSEADTGKPIAVRGKDGPELHVHVEGTDARKEARDAFVAEQRREGLRKLYVALTRAEHHTTAWYGPVGSDGRKTSSTALGRVLMRDPRGHGFDDDAMPNFADSTSTPWTAASQRLDALVARSRGTIGWVQEPPLQGAVAWKPPAVVVAAPRAASWPATRPRLDGPWLVASFTSLAAASAMPDRDEKLAADASADAEGDTTPTLRDGEEAGLARPARASFPERARLSLGGGTRYGTWVHSVLEQLDFRTGTAKDGRAVRDLLSGEAAVVGVGREGEVAELEARLPDLLATPLDSCLDGDRVRGLPAGFALRDLSASDRLDELVFDMRLGDGTLWQRNHADRTVEREPLERRPGRVDPTRVYEAVLAASESRGIASWLDYQRARRDRGEVLLASIVGILTGSIDIVFRTGAPGAQRYYLADYKTNRIAESEAGHYAASWLEWEMARKGYPLQALIYTLALHRHLARRLPGYDYDRHVGGYVYLFLRGMSGPSTPRDPATGRCLGVFGDRWPRATIERLDDALWPRGEGA
jgi:exodeoxyribonuclease V beta subunit